MSLNFGAPSSAPANSSLSGGFSFGANAPKPVTGFGAATSQPSLFGTPATSAPAFGALGGTTPAFGATSTPAFGTASLPAFGATSTPGFGAAATPGFGATSTPGFGAGLGGTSLSFGAGGNTTTTSTGLGFGAPISSATTGGLNFGAPASSASGLGGFSFGGSTTAATTATSLGFSLGSTAAATTPSLFGTTLGAPNVSLSATSAPASVGLGGLATTTAGLTGAADTSAAGKGTSEQQPKQTNLPNEISSSVDAFKEFVKKQKSLSSDVMRVSIKHMQKVSRLAEETSRAVATLAGEVCRERAHARRLRAAAARALAAAELAGRPPPGADSEELAPPAYVLELISELEGQLLTFRRQMDIADRQMQAPHRLLTEQELSLGMRRMHESLVALAGRLQAVHAQVQEQKERYLQLRRHLLKDTTDVFHTEASDSLEQLLREAEGARARGKSPAPSDGALASAVLSDTRAALGSLQRTAGPTPFTHLGSTLSSLPVAVTSGLSWSQPPTPQTGVSLGASGFSSPADASGGGFQLQKAPKRGKQ